MKEQSEKIEVNKEELAEELGITEDDRKAAEDLSAEPPKAKSRKKKKFGKREAMLVIIPAAAALAAVVIASLFVKRASRQTTGEAGVQYYLDTENAVDAGLVIKKSDDGRTLVEEGEHSVQLAELPIYFTDKAGFKITEDMIYYDPRDWKHLRADHFTDFTRGGGNGILAAYGGVEKPVNPGFLYNGKNMFIFLEPVEVRVEENKSVPLSAFSYIEAVPGDTIILFDYDTKTSELFGTGGKAEADAGDYTVQLLDDTLMLSDGTLRLLYASPDLQDPLISAER